MSDIDIQQSIHEFQHSIIGLKIAEFLLKFPLHLCFIHPKNVRKFQCNIKIFGEAIVVKRKITLYHFYDKTQITIIKRKNVCSKSKHLMP